MRNHRQKKQSGQAAVEFVFVLVIIASLSAALFQALHFELDVFNKMNMLRYRVMEAAHKDQDETNMTTISDITVEGKQLKDLMKWKVPLQSVDDTLHYGPKKLVIKHGTKYWDPPMPHGFWAWMGVLLLTHEEDAAEAFGEVVDGIAQITNSIPDF